MWAFCIYCKVPILISKQIKAYLSKCDFHSNYLPVPWLYHDFFFLLFTTLLWIEGSAVQIEMTK